MFPAKTVNVDQSITKEGIKITLHKVEFTSTYTRAFLKIENSNDITGRILGSVEPMAMQGKKQLRHRRFKKEFPKDGFNEINLGVIYPGAEEECVIVFQAYENIFGYFMPEKAKNHAQLTEEDIQVIDEIFMKCVVAMDRLLTKYRSPDEYVKKIFVKIGQYR